MDTTRHGRPKRSQRPRRTAIAMTTDSMRSRAAGIDLPSVTTSERQLPRPVRPIPTARQTLVATLLGAASCRPPRDRQRSFQGSVVNDNARICCTVIPCVPSACPRGGATYTALSNHSAVALPFANDLAAGWSARRGFVGAYRPNEPAPGGPMRRHPAAAIPPTHPRPPTREHPPATPTQLIPPFNPPTDSHGLQGGIRSTTIDQMDQRIRHAVPGDLSLIHHLQCKLHHAVGYTPRGGLIARIESRRILVAEDNGDPAGYVSYTHRLDGTTHLPQIAVHPDLWRSSLGRMLWEHLVRSAKCHASTAITLKCATDLPSNAFWTAVGCELVAPVPGHARTLNAYAYTLRSTPGGPQHAPTSPRRTPIIARKYLLT